jgi:hypothetical protein
VTTPATALVLPAAHPDRAATIAPLGERIIGAARRRAGRFRLALLTFVLFLPLLATAVLGGH